MNYQEKIFIVNDMQIKYIVSYRKVKYSRLEFKNLKLHVVLPLGVKNEEDILNKNRKWIYEKNAMILAIIDEMSNYDLNPVMNTDEFYSYVRKMVEQFAGELGVKVKKIIPRSDIESENREEKDQNIFDEKGEVVASPTEETFSSKRRRYFMSNSTFNIGSRVYIKKMTSQWGSKTKEQNISICSSVRYLPEKLIDYIVFHEVAHFLVVKHNKKFWRLVASKYGNYKEYEAELKKYMIVLENKLKNTN